MHVRNFFATAGAVLALSGGLLPAAAPAFAQTSQGNASYGPVINGFNVEEASRLGPGTELHFELYGSPGGNATIRIDGANRNLHLTEVEPGQYTGTYTMGNRDRIRADSRATAELRLGNQVASRTLGEPLLLREGGYLARSGSADSAGSSGSSGSTGSAGAPREARYCTSCAVVEAVNVVETSGEGSALGTVGGAVVGGLLGSQVGSGSGRTAASVAGAVGGAVAGRQLERNMRRGQRYEVMVRYPSNGATRTIRYDNDPGFRVGDRVRVNNGVLSLDQ